MSERPLTGLIGTADPFPDLREYERHGGYRAARKVLTELAPDELIELVKRSGLCGRGGAGFPTGVKWSFVPSGDQRRPPHYLVVNADEMEPGTFKDRILMEGNPHQLVESIIIACHAITADTAFIFLRWAYKEAERRLRQALAEAADAGYLGEHSFGTAKGLEVHLHTSAGRYICGEETALLNALEGKRATPRAKPPFPPVVGLWGQPTVVNNVETLCNLPHIVTHGAEWFRDLGAGEDCGTKIYGVSGRVERPGWWELPIGVTLGELLEEYAGGLSDGRQLRGVLPGGASTAFLTSEHLDVPLDLSSLKKIGGRLGTGNVIVLDDGSCPVGMVRNLQAFFARESCGWCTPCREGLPWVVRTLDALERGEGRAEDLEILRDHVRDLGMGLTFCALAPGAMEPLASALELFPDDFERHLREGGCPWHR